MEEIKFGQYVELAYQVFTIDENNSQELMHEFTNEAPDRFVFGLEQGMIDGFEKKITGLKKGEKFEFTLEPAEAFGEINSDLIMSLEKAIFSGPDGKFDAGTVKKGSVIPMMTQDGHRVQGIVLDINDDNVIMDFNHPLAGERVKYVGTVIEVRQATQEELNPSCGCGGCSGCGSASDGSCSGCSGNCQ